MTLRKILTYAGVIGFGLGTLGGCNREEPNQSALDNKDHFATFNMQYQSGMAITNGDFDGDGDLDIIVGACHSGPLYEGRLYFFENDGKGNFKLKKPTE